MWSQPYQNTGVGNRLRACWLSTMSRAELTEQIWFFKVPPLSLSFLSSALSLVSFHPCAVEQAEE